LAFNKKIHKDDICLVEKAEYDSLKEEFEKAQKKITALRVSHSVNGQRTAEELATLEHSIRTYADLVITNDNLIDSLRDALISIRQIVFQMPNREADHWKIDEICRKAIAKSVNEQGLE
jgi:NAD-dependent DNA ligase